MATKKGVLRVVSRYPEGDKAIQALKLEADAEDGGVRAGWFTIEAVSFALAQGTLIESEDVQLVNVVKTIADGKGSNNLDEVDAVKLKPKNISGNVADLLHS